MRRSHVFSFAVLLGLGCCAAPPEPALGFSAETAGIHRPARCPRCSHTDLLGIVYASPTIELQRRIDAGTAVARGCILDPANPDWYCKGCGHEWFDADDPERRAAWQAGVRALR